MSDHYKKKIRGCIQQQQEVGNCIPGLIVMAQVTAFAPKLTTNISQVYDASMSLASYATVKTSVNHMISCDMSSIKESFYNIKTLFI